MTNISKRIPYANWINSQLSIARHYGGINLQGVAYRIEKATGDLVAEESKPKTTRKKKQ